MKNFYFNNVFNTFFYFSFLRQNKSYFEESEISKHLLKFTTY